MLQAACDGRVGRRGAQVQLGQARVRARAGRSRGHIRVAALAACAGGAAPTLSEVVWKFLNVRTVACARCQRLTRVLHDPPCQALDDQQACAMQATSSRLLPSPEVSHRQQTLQRAGVCCRLCVCSSRQQRVAAPDQAMTPGLESLACAVFCMAGLCHVHPCVQHTAHPPHPSNSRAQEAGGPSAPTRCAGTTGNSHGMSAATRLVAAPVARSRRISSMRGRLDITSLNTACAAAAHNRGWDSSRLATVRGTVVYACLDRLRHRVTSPYPDLR